ncbi:hypothetical protein N7486_003035 [Penicillium sp. IBT 16267x]|nr:hypothetical protein N7486_003035 [Penicillium sp. IBT 16267x]
MATESPEIRAQQSFVDIPETFEWDIEALSRLERAGCSSTPAWLSHKMDDQTYEEWVTSSIF